MYSKEQIFEKISDIIVELFEVKKEDIKMNSHLFEDLGLDSIDAIDLIGELQGILGKRLMPEDFKTVRTVEDVVKAAEDVLNGQQKTSI